MALVMPVNHWLTFQIRLLSSSAPPYPYRCYCRSLSAPLALGRQWEGNRDVDFPCSIRQTKDHGSHAAEQPPAESPRMASFHCYPKCVAALCPCNSCHTTVFL